MENIKNQLRRASRRMRDSLPPSYRSQACERMLEFLRKLPEYPAARRIFLFSSIGSEPETSAWAQIFRLDGKETYYPQSRSGGLMDFYRVRSGEELSPGAYGILEPDGRTEEAVPAAEDWVLTPGLLFDEKGYRLGYGGGFYDRYMEGHPQGLYIGVAFAAQVRPQPLPAEEYDHPVYYIVTERGIFYCRKESA